MMKRLHDKAIRILAKSMVKTLQREGLGAEDVIRFATELLELCSSTKDDERYRHDDE